MSKRAYKPTNLRALEGGRSNSLPKPGDVSEPKPLPKAPKVHKDIDGEAQKIWKRLAPKLERIGLLTDIDGDMFAMLCQIRSRLATIHKFIETENASLVQAMLKGDPDGGTREEFKQSPYVIMEKQYYTLFRHFAKEFGLSPVARVGLAVGTDEDDGDDLLSG